MGRGVHCLVSITRSCEFVWKWSGLCSNSMMNPYSIVTSWTTRSMSALCWTYMQLTSAIQLCCLFAQTSTCLRYFVGLCLVLFAGISPLWPGHQVWTGLVMLGKFFHKATRPELVRIQRSCVVSYHWRLELVQLMGALFLTWLLRP